MSERKERKKDEIKDKARKLRRTRQVYNLFQDLWNNPFWVSKQLKRENGL